MIRLLLSAVPSFRAIAVPALSAVALASLSGCQWLDPKPDFAAAYHNAVVPQSFLYSSYDPLNEWLDTKIRISIHEMPLPHVFQTAYLSPMRYTVTNLPHPSPVVTVESIGMTRRQFLFSLSHEYGLIMTPVFGAPGQPSYIDIRGRLEP